MNHCQPRFLADLRRIQQRKTGHHSLSFSLLQTHLLATKRHNSKVFKQSWSADLDKLRLMRGETEWMFVFVATKQGVWSPGVYNSGTLASALNYYHRLDIDRAST